MPKEREAIEIVEGIVKSYIEADECGLSNNDFKHEIKALQTVLSMLKERDEKIEYYKKQKNYDEQFKHELLEEIRCLNLDKDEKDRQINLMAERIHITGEYECQNIKCEDNGSITCKDCIKQYFENKAKE